MDKTLQIGRKDGYGGYFCIRGGLFIIGGILCTFQTLGFYKAVESYFDYAPTYDLVWYNPYSMVENEDTVKVFS